MQLSQDCFRNLMTTLSNHSTKLLQDLSVNDWLEHCGEPAQPDEVRKYQFVPKTEARELLLSKKWDDALINAQNGCSTVLPKSEMQRWNSVAKLVGDAIRQNGCSDIASRLVADHLQLEYRRVELVVRTYIHLACVEREFEGFLKRGFFSELCHVCLCGRLPCGLTDHFPNGQLIVY